MGNCNNGEKGVAECEQHGKTDADNEGSVDQAKQQEHLGLQRIHQFRLAGGGFEEARAHDTDADTGASGPEADDEADTNAGKGLNLGQILEFVHLCSFRTYGWLGGTYLLKQLIESVAFMCHRDID